MANYYKHKSINQSDDGVAEDVATMREWRRSCRWLVFLSVLSLVWVQYSPAASAAPPTVYDFRLVQGTAALPVVKLYADIIGSGDVPAKGLKLEDFKAMVGGTTAKVTRVTPFEDAKEGVGFVLLVDVSKSLSPAQFSLMKNTLAAFVDSMAESDRVALATFGQGVKVIQDFTANRSKIKDHIAALSPTDDETAFYSGIDKAIALARTGGADIPGRRVVITLTDGVNDLTGGVSKGDIAERLKADPVPLYLIGFVPGKPSAEEESAIGVMKTFSRLSGGRYYDGRGGEWRGIYFAISRAIRSAFVIEAEATNLRSEGAVFPVSLTLSAANKVWTEKLDLTIPAGGAIVAAPAKQTDAPTASGGKVAGKDSSSGVNQWLWIAAGLVAILCAGGIMLLRRRSKSSAKPAPVAPDPAPPAVQPSRQPGVLVRFSRVEAGAQPEPFDVEIVDRVIIGSDPRASHLVLEQDDEIAAAHCEIVFETGLLYVQDLASPGGTCLNGVVLTERQRIEEQDILQLGRTAMRISFPSS